MITSLPSVPSKFLNKRQKIVLASIFLTIGLVVTLLHNNIFYKVQFVVTLGVIAYFLSLWALFEGMTRLKAITLLILPFLFTIAMASFAYLLPLRWLVRVPVSVVYGLCIYFILLSQNVFNVAAIRTIPLYRAASTVSFLFTLITAFFLYSVLLSLNLIFYWNSLIVFLITFPLSIQILWSIEMEKLTGLLIIISFITSLIVSQLALGLSFWPLTPTMWALCLSSALYIMLGVITEALKERLSRRVVFEYLAIGVIVFIFTTFVTSWTA